MTDRPDGAERRLDGPQDDEDPQRISDRLVVVLMAEGTALAIGLVAPITPSRTGSMWSPAELVTADPSYLEKVAASFLMVNVMLVVLGLVAWIAIRMSGPHRPEDEV